MTRFVPLASLCLGLVGCGLLGSDEAPRTLVPTVEVARFEPTGEVRATRGIVVRFSEPIVGKEAVGQPVDPSAVLVVNPELGGRGRWTAVDTFELEPGRPLAPNTRYQARVRERVVGSGRRLVGDRRFSFRTPLFRVLSAQGQRTEDTLQAVVELSHAVRSEDAAGAITFRDVDGRVLATRLLGRGLQTILRFGIPGEGFDPEEPIFMRVEPTLTPECGGAALDKPVEMRLSFQPRDAPEVVAAEVHPGEDEPTVRVRLDADVDVEQIQPFVRTEPLAHFELEPAHHGFVMRGGFVPGGFYRIQLRGGMPTSAGALEIDEELEVEVPNLSPSIRVEADGPFLSVDGDALSVDLVNVERLLVRAIRVPDRNVSFVDTDTDVNPRLGRVVVERELEGTRAARRTGLEVPLSSLLRGGRGLYRIELEDADHAWVRAAGWVLQRNLQLTAKIGVDYVRAQVQRPGSREAVSGAQVSAYSRTGRRLFSAVTDARGVVEQTGPLDAEDPAAWLIAHAGRDAAYLPLEAARVPLPGVSAAPRAPAFVWTARDYVRGGEQVHAIALLDPPDGSVRFELLGPEGPMGAPLEARSEGGLARVALPVDPTAPAGVYTVRVSRGGSPILGSARLRVVDDDLPVLRVEVSPMPAPPGRPVPFDVEAVSRFGARTEGFRAQGRCRYTPVRLDVDVGSFVFGREEPGDVTPREVEAPPATVDGDGHARLVCPAPGLDTPLGHRVQVDLQVSVFEPGGRPVVSHARTLADPAEHYVGLRHRPGALEVVAVDPRGRPVAGVPLVARVFAAERRRTARRSSGRREVAGLRSLQRFELRSGAGEVRVPFEPRRAGRYRAEVDVAAGHLAAALDFWVLTGTAAEELPHVAVALPDGAHAVGARVPVRLQLPFPGRVQVTVERGRVLYDESHDVEQGAAQLELPILERFAPNARVVVALEGADGRRAYGAAPLRVDVADRRLGLEVNLPEGAGGGRFPVTFRVLGARGRAHAILSVVSKERLGPDEGRPDPFDHLAAPRPVQVTTHDVIGLRFAPRPEATSAPAESVGPPPPPRSVAGSEAYVSDVVRLSERGYGWAAVRPPTGGGRAVLSIVVFDGRAVAQERIPLERGVSPSVRLSAPRALVSGDRVRVPVTVDNPSSASWTVTASVGLRGPIGLVGPGQARISVPAGGTRAVEFAVNAESPGEGELLARVFAPGGETEARATIAVRGSAAADARGAGTKVSNRSPGRLELPGGLEVGAARARLLVGPGRVHRYAAAYDALGIGVPRGPLLAAARGQVLLEAPELASGEGRGGSERGARQLAEDLEAALETLGAEGRVRSWPDGPEASPEVEAQVALLFAEARRAGRPVSDSVWRGVERRMRAILADSERSPVTRARAAFALARGRVRGLTLPAALTEAGAPPAARAASAAYHFANGRTKEGRALLEGDFGSGEDLSRDALTLLALVTVAPGHPAVEPLWSRFEGAASAARWASPDVTAAVLVAAARLDAAAGRGRPYWGSVLVGGQVVKRFNSNRITVLEAPAAAWASGVELTVTGAGEAQAGLSVVGPQSSADAISGAGLSLTRRHRLPTSADVQAGRAELGALWVTEIEVSAATPEGRGPVEVRVPLPAGFRIEQVWPTEVPGLSAAPIGEVDETAEGLRWRVAVTERPARLLLTSRAVRPGRFIEPAAEARRLERPAVRARTAPVTWTVEATR